jgi:hypothetical protein
LNDLGTRRLEAKNKLDSSADDNSDIEPLTVAELKQYEQQIDHMKEEIKKMEATLKHQIVIFQSFKDSSNLVEKFE